MALSFWFLLRRHARTIRLSHNTFTKKTEKSITKSMYAHYSKILFHNIVINPMISVATDHFFIFAFLMTDTIYEAVII